MRSYEGEVVNLLKSKRSLSFYQTAKPINSIIDLRDVNAGIFASTMQGEHLTGIMYLTNSSMGKINTSLGMINSYNTQFQTVYNTLNEARTNTENALLELLSNDSSDDSMRYQGVKQMWDYLKAEAQMGGNSSGFTLEQQRELLEKGKILNFEGHHINSVGAHPNLQTNPDNVIPLEEHRYDEGPRNHLAAHDNNWKKQTEGPLIDRNKNLVDTNNQRVIEKRNDIKTERNNIIKNELVGIGAAIAIGFGVGFTIGFIANLAQNGLSIESVRKASIVGLRAGSTSALIGGISYGITRTIGEIVTKSLSKSLPNYGLEISKNISKMCSMGSIGLLSIVIYSTYQFVNLKRMGYASKEVLLRVGKQALFSLTVLVASVLAQGIWRGHAGLIVSTGVSIIVFSYKCIQATHLKKITEEIQIYTINKCCPLY